MIRPIVEIAPGAKKSRESAIAVNRGWRSFDMVHYPEMCCKSLYSHNARQFRVIKITSITRTFAPADSGNGTSGMYTKLAYQQAIIRRTRNIGHLHKFYMAPMARVLDAL